MVRYEVRDVKTLQRLALYLVSNVGNLVTGNKLRTLFGFGATSTVKEYYSLWNRPGYSILARTCEDLRSEDHIAAGVGSKDHTRAGNETEVL